MIQRKAGKEATSELNLTPMIDIVFQLLIFFMVTAVFAITPGLDIKLPEAEESEAPEKENLFIVIDEQGAMKLNHKSVTYASLKRELMEKRKILDNTTMIVIQADEKVFHGSVVKVMDISKAAGITDLVVATEPKDR
ncbi:MAG: biopolymer transporter ExbD [Candidatus Latescibacteria bacterium]|nr:biopolymer transporter ExbD [Candidatus Latescibacterota bacterium]